MLKGSELQGFEIVDVETKRYEKGFKRVSMTKNRTQLYVSSAVSSELNWGERERITLLKLGQTFAFMPGKVNNRLGCLMAVRKEGTKGNKTYQISSKEMCDKIYWGSDQCTKFEAWADKIEDGRTILFFKPEE